jgi:hypothetical protein
VRFEVITSVTMKTTIFCDVMSCGLYQTLRCYTPEHSTLQTFLCSIRSSHYFRVFPHVHFMIVMWASGL